MNYVGNSLYDNVKWRYAKLTKETKRIYNTFKFIVNIYIIIIKVAYYY